MIFASKTPESLTSNESNPFLVAARNAIAEGATYRDLLDDLMGYQIGYPGCEHVEAAFDAGYRASAPHHAGRVLARLIRIANY